MQKRIVPACVRMKVYKSTVPTVLLYHCELPTGLQRSSQDMVQYCITVPQQPK